MARTLAAIIDNSLLLVAGTIAALFWANLGTASYIRFSHAAHFIVNDVGMVFFFALAAKEIVEATLPGGALASRRRAAVPLIAAAAGMIVPAALYIGSAAALGYADRMRGWAIPCATDIAFSYLTARMVFPRRHPAIPFLLLLAVADDALGLAILALFYPSHAVSLPLFLMLMVPAIGVAWWLRRRLVRSFWPYLALAGGLSWLAMFEGGLHPALALVPIVPFMPHERLYHDLFDEARPRARDTLNRFAQWWHVPTQVVLFFFGLVNAGVTVTSVGPTTWLVALSLLIGKPIGILAASMLSVAAGLRMPAGLRRVDVAIVGVTAGIGFTVALFFATAAFPQGPVLDEAKMGALFSFVAAPIAIALARLARGAGSSGTERSPRRS
jgi:NhaA family Na+:H+ antiporter